MERNKKIITETAELMLNWRKLENICKGVLPCAVQDHATKEVLLIAYVNQEALNRSIKTGIATFWSTSKNKLWVKGKTSGSTLRLVEIRINCEQNSLLYLVKPAGGACHTKDADGKYRRSCFYRIIKDGALVFIDGEKKEK